MHDGQAQSWREVLEKHHAALIDEISVRLDSQLQHAVSHAVEAERAAAAEQTERARKESGELTLRSTAESLNQVFRRLHPASDRSAVLALLAESTKPYAAQTALLEISEGEARLFDAAASPVAFAIDTAPALGSVFESGDPVVTLASADQLSPSLAGYLGPDEERRVYLYPVSERQKVTGILVAVAPAVPAMLEVLSEAAALKLESLSAARPERLEPLPSPGLVQIEPPAGSASERRAWDELSADDQKLHLQGQRVARVRVAEIRLYHAEALRRGATDADIYGALQTEIDAARTEFLQTFLSKSPTMVDYLHLEILRSLAHDDDRLLGKNYPGPMV